jgi:hypothetical protein
LVQHFSGHSSHRGRRNQSTDADKSAKLIWTHEVRPQGEAQKRRVNRGSATAVPSSQHDQRFQIQINPLKLVDREGWATIAMNFGCILDTILACFRIRAGNANRASAKIKNGE